MTALNENAKKWVAALRSGEYKQGKAMLKTENGSFCCLGVACELYRRDVGGRWEPPQPSRYTNFHAEGALSATRLPSPVQSWLGLRTDNGAYGHSSSLPACNDYSGSDFTKIADIIESQPEGLFT